MTKLNPITPSQRVEMFVLQDKLVASSRQQIKLMGDLRIGLIREWAKEDGLDLDAIEPPQYLKLLAKYHEAELLKLETFKWDKVEIPTNYMPYLCEYLEPRMANVSGFGWTSRLKQMKARHAEKMKHVL